MVEYPAAFLREMKELLGAEYPAFEKALSEMPERALRLNPVRNYEEEGTGVVPWEKSGRYLPESWRPSGDIAHFAGAYYMQEASAMAPISALDPAPGEAVADFCAAPGGKSGQIALRMEGRGFLLSNEYDLKRARILSGNLERLGVTNAVVSSMAADRVAKAFPECFDAVLADAPCSGEGMFRKDENARAEWTEQSAEGCRQRQLFILRHAAEAVKKGGRLVYSTCTFNRRENEDVVAEFLAERDDFRPMDFSVEGVGTSRDGMLRLWPHKIRGEGHFVALLKREGEPQERKPTRPTKPEKAALDAMRLLKEALPNLSVDESRLRLFGDRLYLLPEGFEGATNLPALRCGFALCRVGRGYAEPDHALAMAHLPLPEFAVSEEGAKRFLAGEVLKAGDAGGWLRVTWNNLPLGWGKAVSGMLKNHLPKGLRARVS
ncbi:MAG: RsmB/NOP family class I SAM-dependent RNA methyltransferase [Christensenellales bacterium]|jgi:NOL1/NOP2/sun family putative RNA methylase